MIGGSFRSEAPLDEFLEGAGDASAAAERLQGVGLGVAMLGALIVIGMAAFLLVVHRGNRDEVARVKAWLVGGGALVAAGAILELIGVGALFGIGITEVLASEEGRAPLLRLMSGVAVVVGCSLDPATVAGPPGRQRWAPAGMATVGLAGIVLAILSFSFDGHTVTEGPRLMHAILDVVHVTAGGIWAGGVAALLVIWPLRRGTDALMSPLVVRFSGVATVALIAVTIAGAGMSLLIVDAWGDYLGSAWGRRLVLKLVLVAAAAGVGAYNHFRIVSALERDPGDQTMLARARATLRLEAGVFGLIALVTVVLTGASPD